MRIRVYALLRDIIW